MATISSRPPEGAPNWCPVCRAAICVEPSPMGDAPCPSCGTLLWFFDTANGLACCQFAAIAPLRDHLFARIAHALGMEVDEVIHAYKTREPLTAFGADSLDLVEMTMELEQEFGFTIPLDGTADIKTMRDLVDYILRLRL